MQAQNDDSNSHTTSREFDDEDTEATDSPMYHTNSEFPVKEMANLTFEDDDTLPRLCGLPRVDSSLTIGGDEAEEEFSGVDSFDLYDDLSTASSSSSTSSSNTASLASNTYTATSSCSTHSSVRLVRPIKSLARVASSPSSTSGSPPSPVLSASPRQPIMIRSSSSSSMTAVAGSPSANPIQAHLRDVVKRRLEGDMPADVLYDTGLPAAELRKREVRWLEIISNWRSVKKSKQKMAEIKELIRAGIPPVMRSRVWPIISGSAEFASTNPGVFEILVSLGDNEWTDQINADLARTLPSHEQFKHMDGEGQRNLKNVLQAFSHFNPIIGYCQGMGSVAAMFLLNLPAEDAFWLLHIAMQNHIKGYFEPSLKAVIVDAELFGDILKLKYPKLHAHFERLQVTPMIYITPWLMCLFSQTLPKAIVLHIIDILLNEGTYILFKVGYAILKIFKDELLHMTQSTDVVRLLLHPPHQKPELRNATTFMRIANKVVLYKYRATINEVRHKRLVLEAQGNSQNPSKEVMEKTGGGGGD